MGEVFYALINNFVYDPVISASYYVTPGESTIPLDIARRSANDLASCADACDEDDGVLVHGLDHDSDAEEWVNVDGAQADE